MTLHVALTHRTAYHYDRVIGMAPQVIRLRPAPHCRTPILSYSLNLEPKLHFINWQQDPFANYCARVVLPEKTDRFVVTVEEHVLLGGFGSAVTEALTRLELQIPILMIGLPDLFIEQGSQAELKARYRIDAEGIAASIRSFARQGEGIS